MFRKLIYAFFVLALLGAAVPAQAAPITFVYTETDPFNTAFGSFTFDDTLLDGTSAQSIPHSTFTAFSFTFNDQSFVLSNLDSTARFIFDSSEPIPDVIGAAGTTATNGGELV